jgi:hypothetical protein
MRNTSLIFLIALIFTIGSATASPQGMSIVIASQSGITATLNNPQGVMTFRYDEKGSETQQNACYHKPCFIFTSANTSSFGPAAATMAAVTAPGCTIEPDSGEAQCPASGVPQVMLKLKAGGTISTSTGRGKHNGQCSPVAVNVDTGDAGIANITVDDGCRQTVICGRAFASIEIDGADSFRGKCRLVTRNGRPI